jgi:PIN domain nuclease of toxin-antitoxin system
MKYLIDTKVFLWMHADPEKLGPRTIDILAHDSNELYLSAASAWEIAIKYRLGRVVLSNKPTRYVPQRMAASRMLDLPISVGHALGVSELDDGLSDPVDRLLVSQARAHRMRLVTADPIFGDNDNEVVDARR